MKRESLRQVSVTTSLEAEEAVVELLERVFGQPAVVYTNEETHVTVASVYCPDRHEWNAARQSALREGLGKVRASGLNLGRGKITMRRVAREDWSESWKRHFKPIEIGSRLLVKPSWVKRKPRKGQAVVVLDPGLSFGTGNHPTTAYCLRELVAWRKPDIRQSFWDIGTGSGILAIAAHKLGFEPVTAIDFDPEAIRCARANARKNRVRGNVRISLQDVSRMRPNSRQKHHLICANLISNLLLAERERIVSRLHRDGALVLAGILRREFAQVCGSYEALGLRLVRSRAEGEWQSGTLIWREG